MLDHFLAGVIERAATHYKTENRGAKACEPINESSCLQA
jgi:hypothetical protein